MYLCSVRICAYSSLTRLWAVFLPLLLLAVVPSYVCAQHVHYYNEEGQEIMMAHVNSRGDTIPEIHLKEIYCFNRKRFKGKNQELNYWRMVNDVKKTLPIAKEARKLLEQAYDSCMTKDKREQRAYFKQLEKELWVQYKPRLKKLNYRQGKLLVRLVDRECNKQTFQIIKEFLGGTRAFFWQGFGAMFGVSLKMEWDPDGKDKELEDICIQVEQGMI